MISLPSEKNYHRATYFRGYKISQIIKIFNSLEEACTYTCTCIHTRACTHTHTCQHKQTLFGKAFSRNQMHASQQLAHAWFNNTYHDNSDVLFKLLSINPGNVLFSSYCNYYYLSLSSSWMTSGMIWIICDWLNKFYCI